MKIKHINYFAANILFICILIFSYYIQYFFNIYKKNNELNVSISSLERDISRYIELHNKIVLTEMKDFHSENNEIEKKIDIILNKSTLYKSELITIKKLVIQIHEILHEINYSNNKKFFSQNFISNQKNKIINNINRVNSIIHKVSKINMVKLNNIIYDIKFKLFTLLFLFLLVILLLFLFIKIKVLNSIEKLEQHITSYEKENKLKKIIGLPNNEIGNFAESFNEIIQNKLNIELKYEKIFKYSNIGMCTFNKKGEFLSSNKVIDLIFDKSIYNNNILDLYNNNISFYIKRAFIQLIKKKKENIKFNYNLNNKILKCSLNIIWKDNNNIDFFILIIEDITKIVSLKRKEKEQELLILQQSKLASMGEMLASISHQWRQPLNSLGLIFQDMFSAYKHNELNNQYFEKIKIDIMSQLNYMSNTLNEFKSFIKPNNYVLEDFNINDTFNSISNLFYKQLEKDNIDLIINNNINILIKGNEPYLKQVLLNLISNAKDAILNNNSILQRNITMNAFSKNLYVYVEVSDYAGNIDESIISRIYEPYFTTKVTGTGLGLYMSQMILKQSFKSNLKVKNFNINNSKGKTFYFKLHKKQ